MSLCQRMDTKSTSSWVELSCVAINASSTDNMDKKSLSVLPQKPLFQQVRYKPDFTKSDFSLIIRKLLLRVVYSEHWRRFSIFCVTNSLNTKMTHWLSHNMLHRRGFFVSFLLSVGLLNVRANHQGLGHHLSSSNYHIITSVYCCRQACKTFVVQSLCFTPTFLPQKPARCTYIYEFSYFCRIFPALCFTFCVFVNFFLVIRAVDKESFEY